jgi:hypothetical protein
MSGRLLRSGAVLAALLFLSLSLASCGSSGFDEANKLIQSGSEDIKAIDKIVKDNQDKEREISNAIYNNDTSKAITLLDDTLKTIDAGLEKAESAAGKFDRASKLDIDSTIKEYLSLRAQSVSKAIEAFKELRKGVAALRESLGKNDPAAEAKARSDFRETSERFQQLISDAQRLEGQAAEIARRNPDKIKPGL